MHVVFNELSCQPRVNNIYTVENLFDTLKNTYKLLAKTYEVGHILFPKRYSDLQITDDMNFIQCISSFENRDLQSLMLGLCVQPFIDDLTDDEMHDYISGKYKVIDHDVPTTEEPVGLPVAYVKSLPTIGLETHSFWRRCEINLKSISGLESTDFKIFNFCREEKCIDDTGFINWYKDVFLSNIDTKEKLVKYLGYKKYATDITDSFFAGFLEWKKDKHYSHLLRLLKDVEIHPFTGGLGKTENLGERGKECSKRITHSDRLSYSVEDNCVKLIACKGHYKFH